MDHLFQWNDALHDPIILRMLVAMAGIFLVIRLVVFLLSFLGLLQGNALENYLSRYRSFLIVVPCMVVPILLGAFSVIIGIMILALLCYWEFAHATGLASHKLSSAVVVLGILGVALSALTRNNFLFVSLFPAVVLALSTATVLSDAPQGSLHRIGAGTLAFALFGTCLGYLSFLASEANFQEVLLLLGWAQVMNDVYAYVVGKAFKGKKLSPRTSPEKTLSGALGALVLTTVQVLIVGHFVFRGTHLSDPLHLVVLGLIISIFCQLGDLLFSSFKRDLGIKDMGRAFPELGGILDRFDSLVLVPPAVFFYIRLFQ
jgi:phosphatidate cytidylyltransferase